MTFPRAVTFLAITAVLILAAGCNGSSGQSSQATPQYLGPNPGAIFQPTKVPSTLPTLQPSPTLAKVQSARSAQPVTPPASGGPRLAIDFDMVNFGEVPFGGIVALSLNVKNVGSAPLNLGPAFIRVKEGC